jgi:hypothetical protein
MSLTPTLLHLIHVSADMTLSNCVFQLNQLGWFLDASTSVTFRICVFDMERLSVRGRICLTISFACVAQQTAPTMPPEPMPNFLETGVHDRDGNPNGGIPNSGDRDGDFLLTAGDCLVMTISMFRSFPSSQIC